MGSSSKYKLNIAASCVGTHTLGPGFRSIVWVQGCPFHCSGCISPQWIPIKTARQVAVDILVSELLADPYVNGFTFSGGEPFLQARALAELIRQARQQRDLTLICFTGYKLGDLQQLTTSTGINDLLSQIDVLIDGAYQKELNDNRGLRGSSNQVVHDLTDRLRFYDFETQPRNAEIYIRDGEMLFVGVPPQGIIPQVVQDIRLNRHHLMEAHERA